MSALKLLDLLSAAPFGHNGPAREGRPPGAWRAQDGLLAAVGAALLGEGKDGAAARQVLARLIGRGLLGEVFHELARGDAGAAALASQMAARMSRAARPAPRAEAGAGGPLKPDEKSALADWLRLAAAASARAAGSADDLLLRSRLALAWGRLAQLADMGRRWLEDEDARVRANAVESLWGRDDAEAVAVLTGKLDDPHQRVAANAAVGLYLAGRAESVLALWRMSQAPDPARRSAAVWAMGRVGDARFLDLLAQMRKTHGAPVTLLRHVVLARERIRHAADLPRQSARLQIDGVAPRGALSLQVRLLRETKDGDPPLRPTDFALEVNGQPVWEYSAWRSHLLGPAALCLLAPGTTPEDAADRAREIAREAGPPAPALLQSLIGYTSGGGPESETGDILCLDDSSTQGGFARSLAAWRELSRQAIGRLPRAGGTGWLVVAVERGAPAWLGEALSWLARCCEPPSARLHVLYEPESLETERLEDLRAHGAATVQAPGGRFSHALRALLEAPEETWRIETPAQQAEEARQIRVVLRSGWWQGEALAGRSD